MDDVQKPELLKSSYPLICKTQAEHFHSTFISYVYFRAGQTLDLDSKAFTKCKDSVHHVMSKTSLTEKCDIFYNQKLTCTMPTGERTAPQSRYCLGGHLSIKTWTFLFYLRNANTLQQDQHVNSSTFSLIRGNSTAVK